LTGAVVPANINFMAYSFLVFDFGTNEDVAQQARHRIDGWKQGFRLDKKLQVKFDRRELESKHVAASEPSSAAAKSGSKKAEAKGKSKSKDHAGEKGDSSSEPQSDVSLIVRLDFSDHEKLSHQRWLDRIPTEEPFKSAKTKIVRPSDPEFDKISGLFDSLDKHSGARARE
jgi:hypothetical protein